MEMGVHYIRAPFYQKRHFPHYFTLKIGTLRVTWGRHVPPVPPRFLPTPMKTYHMYVLWVGYPHVRNAYLFFEVAVLTRESTVREQDIRPN